MSEICKPDQRAGFLLIASLMVLGVLIVIVTFFLNAIIQDIKVADIVNKSPSAFYLAESGVNEAVWRVQNDAAWRNSFETDDDWRTSFTREDSLILGASYAVSIANTALADAEITATGTAPVRGTAARRVIKARVYKALNTEPVSGIALYAQNGLESSGSVAEITGNVFSNQDIEYNLGSNWTVAGEVQTRRLVEIDSTSTVAASAIHDETSPPIPDEILMPQIDLDSDNPGSYKSSANQIYTAKEFKNLLDDFPVTTLNGITYVTGNVYVKKGDNLTINGLLAADGAIKVGNGASGAHNPATLTVNNAPGQPSGIISKNNITIGGFDSEVVIDGLVYAGGEFRVQKSQNEEVNVSITGGVFADQVSLVAVWDTLYINLDETIINDALGTPTNSQLFVINHWEEQY